MDSSIKISVKVPSKWAHDLPVIIGIIFVTYKFTYLFSLFKITNKNEMNYYNKLIIYLFFLCNYFLWLFVIYIP